jgi:hypothetical protein
MRAFRICSYGLLLFPLLGMDCCDSRRNSQQKDYDPIACTVSITMLDHSQCTVKITGRDVVPGKPEWVQVHRGDSIAWKNEQDSGGPARFYLVNFPFGEPFDEPSFAVNKSKKVIDASSCKNGSPTKKDGCDFEYEVRELGNKCSDPGVRVVPPNQVPFLSRVFRCVKSLI